MTQLDVFVQLFPRYIKYIRYDLNQWLHTAQIIKTVWRYTGNLAITSLYVYVESNYANLHI